MRLSKALLLFLVLVLYSHGEPLKESFSLKVRVVGKIKVEKPRLEPPEQIELTRKGSFIDLSPILLLPPINVEKEEIEPLKGGGGCGEPKDRVKFRSAVNSYLKGSSKRARSLLYDVLSIQGSPYHAPAQYLLGLIELEEGREDKALSFFKRSCLGAHMWRRGACEAYYGLYFKLEGQPFEQAEDPFWSLVASIKKGKGAKEPECSEVVFKRYCDYVRRFIRGEEGNYHPDSLRLRKAILLLKGGKRETAKSIFADYEKPGSRWREIALYYLGVILAMEGKREEAYKKATYLETLGSDLSRHLYIYLSFGDPLYGRIAYGLSRDKDFLLSSAILAYNRGRLEVAYADFVRAGEPLYALWSAVRMGNYQLAYRVLKDLKPDTPQKARWYLEVLFWNGKFDEMERVLSTIQERVPEVYREYMGWLHFVRGEWERAYQYFDDPYFKALSLFNAGRYREVLEILKGKEGLRERILMARSAISLGNGKLARQYLKGNSPGETYLRGMSYFIEGRYKRAVREFEKIKGEGELGLRALLRIGDSYYNMNMLDRAREIYREILTDHRGSAVERDAVLALAQIELQSPTAGIEELYEEFIKRFPDSPLVNDLKYQLAEFYIKKGEETRARSILEELLSVEGYRARALLRLASLEDNPERKEDMLREVIRTGGGEIKDRATGMLMGLFVERREFEKLADFLMGGDYDDKKKALEIYVDHNLEKAIDVFDRLYGENKTDEDLKRIALKLYKKTKGRKYLRIASTSADSRVRAEALYKLGVLSSKKDRRKALEYFVEVVLTAEGVQPYYNNSIMRASEILVKLKAKRDASCLLDKLDRRSLTRRELKRVKILKKKLPECRKKS